MTFQAIETMDSSAILTNDKPVVTTDPADDILEGDLGYVTEGHNAFYGTGSISES